MKNKNKKLPIVLPALVFTLIPGLKSYFESTNVIQNQTIIQPYISKREEHDLPDKEKPMLDRQVFMSGATGSSVLGVNLSENVNVKDTLDIKLIRGNENE